MTKALSVWWDNTVVGTLSLNRHGDMRFTYSGAWLADAANPALSVSLPKRPESFSRRECRPFFEGLLPEAAQRDAVAKALGISSGNEFQLLDALGGDVAGALTFWPEDATPVLPDSGVATESLSDDELVNLLDSLPLRPFLAGKRGFRLSLAGAQSKIPVVLVNDRVALPAPGQPTTHILKPPIARFSATTENEAFAMRLALSLGLDVAPVQARAVASRPYLLVTRYDRRIDAAGRVYRLHQEDFCQALGVISDRKYAAEGGPGFSDCFKLIRRACTKPAVDVLKLLDAAIAQVIIGNADAHGKNYSLVYREGGIEFSPLYDLLCTVAYPELSAKFAMKIAKRGTLEDMRLGDWDKFAIEAGLGAPFVRRRVKKLSALAEERTASIAAGLAESGLSEAALIELANHIANRAKRLITTV
ncbi:MAG: type II toxin-antitoxin system HipA family toxin [Rhodomicrobium sp.]